MYNDLKTAYPQFSHYYTVGGLSMNDALERCARMTGEDANVFNFNGAIIFALTHALTTAEIDWLNPVAGTPEEE